MQAQCEHAQHHLSNIAAQPRQVLQHQIATVEAFTTIQALHMLQHYGERRRTVCARATRAARGKRRRKAFPALSTGSHDPHATYVSHRRWGSPPTRKPDFPAITTGANSSSCPPPPPGAGSIALIAAKPPSQKTPTRAFQQPSSPTPPPPPPPPAALAVQRPAMLYIGDDEARAASEQRRKQRHASAISQPTRHGSFRSTERNQPLGERPQN